MHFRELQRASGYGNGALLYSLRILASAHLIRSENVKGRRHYYAVASVEFHELDALLHGLRARRLAKNLLPFREQDALLRRDLVQHMQDVGEARPTAYRLIKRLQEAQVLDGDAELRLARVPAMMARVWPSETGPMEVAPHPSVGLGAARSTTGPRS